MFLRKKMIILLFTIFTFTLIILGLFPLAKSFTTTLDKDNSNQTLSTSSTMNDNEDYDYNIGDVNVLDELLFVWPTNFLVDADIKLDIDESEPPVYFKFFENALKSDESIEGDLVWTSEGMHKKDVNTYLDVNEGIEPETEFTGDFYVQMFSESGEKISNKSYDTKTGTFSTPELKLVGVDSKSSINLDKTQPTTFTVEAKIKTNLFASHLSDFGDNLPPYYLEVGYTIVKEGSNRSLTKSWFSDRMTTINDPDGFDEFVVDGLSSGVEYKDVTLQLHGDGEAGAVAPKIGKAVNVGDVTTTLEIYIQNAEITNVTSNSFVANVNVVPNEEEMTNLKSPQYIIVVYLGDINTPKEDQTILAKSDIINNYGENSITVEKLSELKKYKIHFRLEAPNGDDISSQKFDDTFKISTKINNVTLIAIISTISIIIIFTVLTIFIVRKFKKDKHKDDFLLGVKGGF